MKALISPLFARLGWASGTYVWVQVFRLVTSVVLARLLAPDLLGLMLIVNTLRIGVELLSDVGIGQNIVSNRNSEDPEFYNTAWTIQIIRGIILSVLWLAVSFPLASFYDDPRLVSVLPLATFFFVIAGFESTARFILQKRLSLGRLSLFECGNALASAFVHVFMIWMMPTILSLVVAGIIATLISAASSHLLIRGMRHTLTLSRSSAYEIVSFGKWIFLSSIIYFLSMNFDRLYVAKALPLTIVGVYGIARALADLFTAFANRMGNLIIFPIVASSDRTPDDLRAKLSARRPLLLAGVSLTIAAFVAAAELIVSVLYDWRYQAAGQLLPVLGLAVWFSVLSTFSEAVLLGLRKPSYGAFANILKLVGLMIALPLGVSQFGVFGAVWSILSAELLRYAALHFWLQRERVSFLLQDLLLTLLLLASGTSLRALLVSADLTSSSSLF